MAKKVLLTGFDPFDGEVVNPSYDSLLELGKFDTGDADVVVRRLPVTFLDAGKALIELVNEIKPDVVICFGQAGGRSHITVERVAINVSDSRIVDNSGFKPVDEPIVAGAPVGYFTSLPLKPIIAALNEAGIPADVSNTAGTYVCNNVMYNLLHLIDTKYKGKMIGGFIHVPYSSVQATSKRDGVASMPLSMISEAIAHIVKLVSK